MSEYELTQQIDTSQVQNVKIQSIPANSPPWWEIHHQPLTHHDPRYQFTVNTTSPNTEGRPHV
jgi:hypothetical protein